MEREGAGEGGACKPGPGTRVTRRVGSEEEGGGVSVRGPVGTAGWGLGPEGLGGGPGLAVVAGAGEGDGEGLEAAARGERMAEERGVELVGAGVLMTVEERGVVLEEELAVLGLETVRGVARAEEGATGVELDVASCCCSSRSSSSSCATTESSVGEAGGSSAVELEPESSRLTTLEE